MASCPPRNLTEKLFDYCAGWNISVSYEDYLISSVLRCLDNNRPIDSQSLSKGDQWYLQEYHSQIHRRITNQRTTN